MIFYLSNIMVFMLDGLWEHVAWRKNMSFRCLTSRDLIEYLRQKKKQRFLLTYAAVSELPPNISTMSNIDFITE